MSDHFSIYILKAQPNSLAQAENFLRNRKWIVGSGCDLRQALAYIIQHQPQYVIITADHPNKKVLALPRMLAQAFPVRVIGFSEKGTGPSIKELQGMNLEYNLHPPVSGPAIERMILKIRRDEETRAQQNDPNTRSLRSENGNKPSDLITFKGDGLQGRGSFEQGRAALTQMLSAETNDPNGPNLFAVQPGIDPTGIAYNGGPSENPEENSATQDGPTSRTAFYNGGVGLNPADSPALEEENSNLNLRYHPEPEESDSERSDWKSRTPTETASDDSLDPANVPQNEAGPASSRNKSKVPVMESEYIPKKALKEYQLTQEERKKGKQNDSIIVRGTQQVLEETILVTGTEEPEKLEKASHLACITIRSPRFSGYLVCAMAKNRPIDETLISVIQQRLFNFLKANGEDIKEDEPLNLQIEEVEFTDWSLEQAEFLRNSVLDGSEFALAFFPNPEVEVKLDPSISTKMLKLALEDLKEDVPLEFDLYIFMPANNRYLLFTPKGLPFYGHQKGRLKTRGVTHMHIPKSSAKDVKKYKVQNFLNDKVTDYKSKKKKKNSA